MTSKAPGSAPADTLTEHQPAVGQARLSSELEIVIDRLRYSRRRILFDSVWDYSEGLNAVAINELASILNHGPVFEYEASGDRRQLHVRHPVAQMRPIIWTLWAKEHDSAQLEDLDDAVNSGPKFRDTLGHLNAWIKIAQALDLKPVTDGIPDPYAVLRRFALTGLKGQERAVIDALCDAGGELLVANLAVRDGVGWEDPFQGFKDAQRRLNPKLMSKGWRVSRRNNAGVLVALGGAKRGQNAPVPLPNSALHLRNNALRPILRRATLCRANPTIRSP